MPKANTNPEAILAAIKEIDILSELLEDRNKNNLKIIVEGKEADGKRIGPYARLLTYAPGEVLMNEGDWGGNTFYFSVDADLDVFTGHGSDPRTKVGSVSAGACFGEMAILAGAPRSATIISSENGRNANVLEILRPALRLLRSLKKFAERIDATYRAHGLANTIAQLQESAGDVLTGSELVALGNLSQFMAYGKHHLLIQEGTSIEKI